jgi:hypothetical protein
MDRRTFLVVSASTSAAVFGEAATASVRVAMAVPRNVVWLRIPGDQAIARGIEAYVQSSGQGIREVPALAPPGRAPGMAALHRFMLAHSGDRILAVSDDANAVALAEALHMARGRVVFSAEHAVAPDGAVLHGGWGRADRLSHVRSAGADAMPWTQALGFALADCASHEAGPPEKLCFGPGRAQAGGLRLHSFIADLPRN